MFETMVALAGASFAKLDDRSLAYVAGDASDAIVNGLAMGRDQHDPSMLRYLAELTAAQDEQNFRARLAAALAS